MRALLVVLGLALVALPAAAQPVERLAVEMTTPGPGWRVVLYEDPACATHVLLWEGAVFTLSDLSRWAVGEDAREPGELTDRLMASYFWANGWVAREAAAASRNVSAWRQHPGSAAPWAVEQVGHEDVCMLSLVSLEDGAQV